MIDEKKLEERLVALEAAKSWSPRVVSRLETLLRSGTDEALYRINPIQFATEKSIAEAEGIDLFLHACVVGLFDMDWLLVCPMCSDVVESFRNLRKLHTHFHCHLCQSDYEAALDDYISVTFTVSPAVRSIRFHQPDALSAWDYLFHYKLTPGGVMPDGVPWSEAAKGLVKALTRIEPGSTAHLEVDAAEGGLMGQDFDSDAQFFSPLQAGRVKRHHRCRSYSIAANAWPPQRTSHPARSCSKFATPASCRRSSASCSFRRRRFNARRFASRHPYPANDC
jgi:hypothetical protein